MAFTFNTGRGYTPEGQLITVKVDNDEQMAYFEDHSRMICGKVPYTTDRQLELWELARHIMFLYDNGTYEQTNVHIDQCEKVYDLANEL